MIRIPIEATPDSPNWNAARRGKLTASRMDDAMSFNKTGASSQRRTDYMMELVAERMTGIAQTHFVTPAMQWGIDHEKDAIATFESETGLLVHGAGLVLHPGIDEFAGTPDGFVVSSDGRGVLTVEVKCPTTKTFVEWRLAGKIPQEYRRQMIAQMACCGVRQGIFIAYDPRVTVGRNIFWHPLVLDDEQEIEEIEAAAKVFLEQVEEMFVKVTQGEA